MMRKGKSYKVEFVRKAFRNDPVYQPFHEGGSAGSKAAFKKAFKTFKSNHARTITARNCLLQLYEQVRIPLISCVVADHRLSMGALFFWT